MKVDAVRHAFVLHRALRLIERANAQAAEEPKI
jgi:hypothetical protein